MSKFSLKFLLLFGISVIAFSTVYAAVPAGYYYFAKNKKKAELKTALHTYCAPMKEFEYGSGPGFTWEGFYYTDRNADNSVIDMYSNTVRTFSGFSSIEGMHIEHSFPKSWWGAYDNNAYKDLFHLYPADATTNITKSNLPLGEVTGTPTLDNGVSKIGTNGFQSTYTENCFEPANEYKGDFARSYFYISTIYENFSQLWQSPMLNNNTYPVWKPWALDLLLKWHRQDPVSAKELKRIETIYGIQGNRNPFIDYPDLAEYIWGADSTKVYPFPDETEAFLLTPRRGTTMDFGVILQNDTRSQVLHIQGVNISSNVQVSLIKNNPTLSLSTLTVPMTNALNGIDLTITFTPTTSGVVRDTLLVQGGGLTESLRIPIKALASADFITLEPTEISPVGGTLQWISDPLATDYHLKVFQGEQRAGDLIIATYVEGSSWNKALEIYNGTGKAVDLSKYSIQKQANGAGDFGSGIQLSGTLQNSSSYVLVNSRCTTTALTALAQRLDSLINFNGNDAVALVRSGVIIDQIGIADAGASVIWGENLTFQRKSTVTHPASKFNQNEWTTMPIDSYSMLGNHQMAFLLSEPIILQDVMTGKTTSYPVQNLSPLNTYTYSVEAIKTDGNSAAINTMQLHTTALDIPILMLATDINTNGFTANWEETLHATGYLVNVLEISGQADTTVVEGFDNVGSNGKPLPTGWSGTASGTYTSEASKGIAIPSMNLKVAGEILHTKTYTNPVSKLTYMYRYASASVGSSFVVYGFNGSDSVRIDSIPYAGTTSKLNPVYTFTPSQNFTAFSFKFNKVGGGNIAIDDVTATYGSQKTIIVQKDIPTTTTHIDISGLNENNLYYYNVRSTLGTAVSLPSETIAVQTLLNNKINQNTTSFIKIIPEKDHISIIGLRGDERIQIYSLTGICVYQTKANANQMNIPFQQNGIFIVHVQNNQSTFTGKFLK